MKRLVIILGMHRSGTSLVSQACQCMGAYLGEKNELLPATKANQDGFFENLKITDLDNDIMQLCNRRWYDLKELEWDSKNPKLLEKVGELKVCIQKLFKNSDKVAVKDPRISLLLPLWEKIICELDIEVRYIWVFRNPLEVAESLRKRNGYSIRHGILLWGYYNLSISKFLEEKDYFLLDYEDILKDIQVFEDICGLFDRKFDDVIKRKLENIVKPKYCHSTYSKQDVENVGSLFVFDLYNSLLKRYITRECVFNFEKQYLLETADITSKYIDYEILEKSERIEDKRIIIYGAGDYGKRAARMFTQLGISRFDFCDRDTCKQEMKLMGRDIFSIADIEKMGNFLIVIAIDNEEIKRAVEQTLACIKGVKFLSFFTLKLLYVYYVKDYSTLAAKAEAFSIWHEELESRWRAIKSACESSVLVYQNGKVGSLTVSESIQTAGVNTAHLHRVFFEKDIVGELILGKNYIDFRKNSEIFLDAFSQYRELVKEELKHKKIITMVRDPIAVDLSTVFQWIGMGIADRYFAEGLRQGKDFARIVLELMLYIKNRMFDWFETELREAIDINIFEYPFEQEEGYSIISKEDVEVLIIKTENLSLMTDVIKRFTGIEQLEIINKNVGEKKDYSHIYKEVLKKLKLPREYVEQYYVENPYMDYFYTKEEKRTFYDRWIKYT